MNESRELRLERLIARFVGRYPQFVSTLSRMDPTFDPRVGAMAVSPLGKRIRLHIHPDFFDDHSDDALLGVILHEVHHVVLGHVGEPRYRWVEHPDLMEIAMETSANEYIREELPGKPATWDRLEEHGVRSGQSTLERYALLVKAREAGRLGISLKLVSGVCHGAGKGSRPGTRPGELLERLAGGDGEPLTPLDWTAELLAFLARSRPRTLDYGVPNRRFPEHLGIIPGRVRLTRPVGKPSLLVAIDTSRSMESEELQEIRRQLVPMSRVARMTIVECDSAIQRIYPFQGKLHDVAGRGGTDLRPVFTPGLRRRLHADGVVYFTDGEGPYPEKNPGIRTLWVLTKGQPFHCPWGRQTRLTTPAPKTDFEVPTLLRDY